MTVDLHLPAWSLCIATLNRRDALLRTLAFATHQTCPPRQIVVVDASDDWEETRARVARLLETWPDIALDYVSAAVRSSATQRNDGIALCWNEIIFLIDDDSFLHHDCAEQILGIYAADSNEEVAAVAATLVSRLPSPLEEMAQDVLPERKASGRRVGEGLKSRILQTGPGRWFNRKALLQSMDELFIRYDEPRARHVPASLSDLEVVPVSFMPGSAMTVRRSIALAEPFDTALRFYAAFEDLDASYRYGRHGAVLRAQRAHLQHFEAAGGRLKRRKLVIFQLLNMLVFLKRHAADPDRFLPAYRRLLRRRLLGETLKDLFSGRIGLPQARGVLTVMQTWRKVWQNDTASIDEWYPRVQEEILDGLD